MVTENFNLGWEYRHLDSGEWQPAELPHDAMICEKRTMESAGGVNTGWFEGYDYEYRKEFVVPGGQASKNTVFEFEGVYHNAEVYINGQKAAERPYGYTNFYVDADAYLRYGEKNEIRVIARNADQPNSRWYSGAGIYRPVHMHVLEKEHILLNGIRIRTVQVDPAIVEIRVRTNAAGSVSVTLLRDGKAVAVGAQSSETAGTDGSFEAVLSLSVEDAVLWTPETPAMYSCVAVFGSDRVEQPFGIRTQSCDRENGFCLNGKRVILRGACVHHDNGVLGARCYAEAEERKVRLLKENGYNAIRSSHNPCSKAMLDACDRLGMLVLDEYVDMWYIHKNKYDYAAYVEEWYERDISDMVAKDYNHPSVIMYSLGNEVAETGEKRGIELFKKMRDVCKRLDADRPVTTGVNIFFNYLYSLGFGVYSDEKAEKNPNKEVGSAFFNKISGIFGAKFMKMMAKLPGCDRKTRDCYAEMDAAGYNYGILRYKHDLKKYPGRVILGSETFCSDAYQFAELAKDNNGLIGDFVWAGMDYLGEVGIGSWEYSDYAPTFLHDSGWLAAGSGRIDLVGNIWGEALYTKVAYGLTDQPQIAVVPVSNTGESHSPSSWRFTNALPSWSWNGLDGKKAQVEVYSRAPMVELFVNGKSAGRKKLGKNCRYVFKTRYQSGEVVAVAMDAEGKELSRNSLRTAGEETVLSLQPEIAAVKAGGLLYVNMRYTDADGTVKPLERGMVSVNVEGGTLLGVGCAAPYNTLGFDKGQTDTYYGAALAVIKAGPEGKVTLRATDGKLSAEVSVPVQA